MENITEMISRYQHEPLTITSLGGMQNFSANYPYVSKMVKGIIDEDENLGDIKWVEDRLSSCAHCEKGEGCLTGVFSKGGQPSPDDRAGEKPVDLYKGEWETEECEKWKQYRYIQKIKSAGIPPRFMRCSFQNFKPQHKSQKNALQKCISFAEEIEDRQTGILMAGKYGVGKTHLAVATTKQILFNSNKRIAFHVVPTLLAKARQSMRYNDADNPLEHINRIEILVLDDLGAEKVTDWVREQLYLLINYRYEHELLTLITTNSKLDELEKKVGGAIVSRIWGMCEGVAIEGNDYRKRR